MTTLNFALTRALARELRPGDEVLVTKLDHDAQRLAVAPARATTSACASSSSTSTTTPRSTSTTSRRRLAERTRVVAFPWASNAVGTVQDVAAIAALAHDAGALAWVDAVHYAPHGPIDVAAVGADVLLCSPYKFFGPHLGLAFGRRELLESWRPYKVRPAPVSPAGQRYETGTPASELLAGFVAAVDYIGSLGWDAIVGARTGARRALPRRAPRRLHAPRPADDGGPRAHLRAQRRGTARRRRSRPSSGSRGSRSGTATTTRSRSCAGSASSPRAPSASGSSTTTPPTRSTDFSRRSRRCEAPRPRRDEVPRPCDRRGGALARPRGDDVHARRDEPRPVPGDRAAPRRPRRRPLRARGPDLGRGDRHLRATSRGRARVGGARSASSGFYVFVSSISVYPRSPPRLRRVDARSTSWRTRDDGAHPSDYGALKAACEQVVDEVFGERSRSFASGSSSARTTRPTASRTGPTGSPAAVRCSHRERRTGRGSSSTCATALPSRSTSRSAACRARST